MREAIKGGSGDNLEMQALRKDGSKFWISISWRPILDSKGRSLGFRTSSQDVTERKRAEEALRQASLKLGMLNSITRHDILNQMQVLTGYLALFKLREKDPELVAYLEKMSRAATQRTTADRFHKGLSGHRKPSPDLGIDRSPDRRGICPVTLERCGVGGKDRRDRDTGRSLAMKVPYNLIDNSMRHGEHVNRIKMSIEQIGGAMKIIYEDNGVGIGSEDKERIFNKGYGKNTGLGLFLIREVLAITGTTIRECGNSGMASGSRSRCLRADGVEPFSIEHDSVAEFSKASLL